MSEELEQPDPNYQLLLGQLIGELAARELSLKTGRSSQCNPQEIAVPLKYLIPPEFDLCVHLATNQPEMRGALLLQREEAALLVHEAIQRQSLPDYGNEKDPMAKLFQEVFARPIVLLAFLSDQLLHLMGATVQEVDTETRRKVHEIAFHRQALIPLPLAIHVSGLPAMQAVLLLSRELLAQATVRLTDPVAAQITEDIFLEHVDVLDRELVSWLEAQEQEVEQEINPVPSLDEEVPDVGVDALDEVLSSLLAELPQSDQGVVMKSPEDLLFAQLFFPGQLATYTRLLLNCPIRIKPIEMASLPLCRMCDEPPGLMARTLYTGAFEGDTAFVFPEKEFLGLAERTEQNPTDLVNLLLAPGLQELQGFNPALDYQVKPTRLIDFSRLKTDNEQLSIRIVYRMEIAGAAPLEFVQYAPMTFVNQLMQILLGPDVQYLQPNERNLMLSFLDLNAALAGVALQEPARAQAWIGPLLGPEYVPLFRPGETLPDLFDFNTLLDIYDRELRQVMAHPAIGKLKPRVIACALAFAWPELKRKILHNTLGKRRGEVEKELFSKAKMSLKEIWDAQHEFGYLLYHAVLQEVTNPPVRICNQLNWLLDRLGTEWKVRAASVLNDRVFFVAGLMDFASLAELSDRDLQHVLASPFMLARKPEELAGAISPRQSEVRGKVLRNLSDRRRREIEELLRAEQWSTEQVQSHQRIIAQVVYFMALRKEIDPPEGIHRQVASYLAAIDEQLLFRAHGVMQDRTFFSMVAELSPNDLHDLQRLVKREDILWALQDGGSDLVTRFAEGMGEVGRARLVADIGFVQTRVADSDERVCRAAAARLRVIDAMRLVQRFRREQE